MVCPLFHPVLFSVCQCRWCNWGLALDKGKKYPKIFAPLLSESLWKSRHAVFIPCMIFQYIENPRRSWRNGRYGDASKRSARPISHDEL